MSEAVTDEQLSALKAFARWAIKETAWVGCDLDGGAVQDEALKLGIIEERTATKDNFAEWKYCEDVVIGEPFYVFADWVKKVPGKDASDESPEGKAGSESLSKENEKLRAALSWIIKTYPANNARLIHNEQQIISIATKALQDKSDE